MVEQIQFWPYVNAINQQPLVQLRSRPLAHYNFCLPGTYDYLVNIFQSCKGTGAEAKDQVINNFHSRRGLKQILNKWDSMTKACGLNLNLKRWKQKYYENCPIVYENYRFLR